MNEKQIVQSISWRTIKEGDIITLKTKTGVLIETVVEETENEGYAGNRPIKIKTRFDDTFWPLIVRGECTIIETPLYKVGIKPIEKQKVDWISINDVKVGDWVKLQYDNSVAEGIIGDISWDTSDNALFFDGSWWGLEPSAWQIVETNTLQSVYKPHYRLCLFENAFSSDENLDGYFYDATNGQVISTNKPNCDFYPLKPSINQKGEKVWKLRKTWFTDTEIERALGLIPIDSFEEQDEAVPLRYMIIKIDGDISKSLASTEVFFSTECVKTAMQQLAIQHPNSKFTAVVLTNMSVQLDSEPKFKWD